MYQDAQQGGSVTLKKREFCKDCGKRQVDVIEMSGDDKAFLARVLQAGDYCSCELARATQ